MVARFVEQVRETGATVLEPGRAVDGVDEALALHGAARVVLPADLDPALRPTRVDVVVDDGLGRTSSTRSTGRSRRARRPAPTRGRSRSTAGRARAAAPSRSCPTSTSASCAPSRSSRPCPSSSRGSSPPPMQAVRSSSSPVRRPRPTSASSGSRASTARGVSSSCSCGSGLHSAGRGVAQPGRAPGLGAGGSSVRVRPPRSCSRAGIRRSGFPPLDPRPAGGAHP